MSVEYARVRVVTCISCNESVQRVGPTSRVCSKITPAVTESKRSGQLQQSEPRGLEDFEGFVKFTVGGYEDDKAVSATRQ